MELTVTGLNYRSAPIEVRERLAFDGERAVEVLRELVHLPQIFEAMLLSTCNRVELYAVTGDAQKSQKRLKGYLAWKAGFEPEDIEEYIYTFSGSRAIDHIFKVASSLDSMVVGEAQILGQVKSAYRQACEAHTTGALLNKLIMRAFSVAKRVRSQTHLGAESVSMGSVAVDLSQKIFGSIETCSVLVVGAGKIGRLIAQHLSSRGMGRFTVTNRSLSAAEKLAKEFGADVRPFEELCDAVEKADIVLCSTASSDFVLRREDISKTMKRKKHSPLFIIDLSVPRNVEPEVGALPNVYLYNADDMQQVVEANLKRRIKEAGIAQHIIEEEVAGFLNWLRSEEVVPLIKTLREKFLSTGKEELRRTLPRLKGIDEEGKNLLNIMMEAFVNKLLHEPVTKLKEESKLSQNSSLSEAVRMLFNLDSEVFNVENEKDVNKENDNRNKRQ